MQNISFVNVHWYQSGTGDQRGTILESSKGGELSVCFLYLLLHIRVLSSNLSTPPLSNNYHRRIKKVVHAGSKGGINDGNNRDKVIMPPTLKVRAPTPTHTAAAVTKKKAAALTTMGETDGADYIASPATKRSMKPHLNDISDILAVAYYTNGKSDFADEV